jgi:uncharacterized protein (TIGR00369 family)
MNSERINQLLTLFRERPRIVRTFGMQLSFTGEGNAVVELPYNRDLDHGRGGIHGGVYCTLLDTAGWFTAAAHRDLSTWVATGELSVHFLAPARETTLRAEGRIIKSGRRQDVCEMRLYDAEDRLVGHATGTFVWLPDVTWE